MSTGNFLRRIATACAILFLSLTVHAQQMPLVALSVGMYSITAEMAHTPRTRATGLMHRESMPDTRGMVFVFEHDGGHCMWMRNTLIPLSVAFAKADGTILNIADMTPHSEQSHCAEGPARFALEMNQGWFAKRGIKPGDRIGGISKLQPAR